MPIEDAIGEAAVEIQKEVDASRAKGDKPGKTKAETPKEDEETSEEAEEETTEETEESDDDKEVARLQLEEQENKEAQILYRALKDPKQRGPVIAALAQELGILNKSKDEPETPKELKATKKATLDVFKEALGKDFEFLAERLSTAIDQVLGQEREEVGSIKQQIQTDRVIAETAQAGEALNKETKGDFKKYESQISKLIDEYQPGPGMTVKKYLYGLYQIASSGSQKVKVVSEITDKINRNKNDASSRLRSTTHGGEDKGPKEFRGKGALNNSVEYALEKVLGQQQKK